MQNIDNVNVYFDADGKQVKGDTRHVNGATYHFEKDSGRLTRNAFASDKNGNWYYLGHDGKALTGSQVIDNIPLYFYPNGVQAKDAFVILDGNSYYFQKDTGQLVRDRFWSDDDGNWYYSDKEGKLLTGEQTIDGFDMYFYPDGVQAKGEIVTIGIEPYYFDKDSGHKVINTDITINGKTYHAEANGLLIETEQKLPQLPLVSGGHFQEDSSGNWYYYTATGEKLRGWQNVDGVTLYFDEEGRQAKDGERIIDGFHYYFSHYSGAVKPTIGILGLLKSEDGNHLQKRITSIMVLMVDVTMDGIELAINFIILIILVELKMLLLPSKDKNTSLTIMENW